MQEQMQEQLNQIQAQLAAMQATLDALAKASKIKTGHKSALSEETLLRYITNSKRYTSDKQFVYFLQSNVMPRRKLLKLSKLKSATLDIMLRKLIDDKRIKEVNCMYPNGVNGERGYMIL